MSFIEPLDFHIRHFDDCYHELSLPDTWLSIFKEWSNICDHKYIPLSDLSVLLLARFPQALAWVQTQEKYLGNGQRWILATSTVSEQQITDAVHLWAAEVLGMNADARRRLRAEDLKWSEDRLSLPLSTSGGLHDLDFFHYRLLPHLLCARASTDPSFLSDIFGTSHPFRRVLQHPGGAELTAWPAEGRAGDFWSYSLKPFLVTIHSEWPPIIRWHIRRIVWITDSLRERRRDGGGWYYKRPNRHEGINTYIPFSDDAGPSAILISMRLGMGRQKNSNLWGPVWQGNRVLPKLSGHTLPDPEVLLADPLYFLTSEQVALPARIEEQVSDIKRGAGTLDRLVFMDALSESVLGQGLEPVPAWGPRIQVPSSHKRQRNAWPPHPGVASDPDALRDMQILIWHHGDHPGFPAHVREVMTMPTEIATEHGKVKAADGLGFQPDPLDPNILRGHGFICRLSHLPLGRLGSGLKQTDSDLRQRIQDVKSAVQNIPTGSPNGAIVELTSLGWSAQKNKADPKNAIRRGLGEVGIASKFCDTVPDDWDMANLEGKLRDGGRRIRASVLGILRQCGLMPSSLGFLNDAIGLPSDLTVMAVWVFRTSRLKDDGLLPAFVITQPDSAIVRIHIPGVNDSGSEIPEWKTADEVLPKVASCRLNRVTLCRTKLLAEIRKAVENCLRQHDNVLLLCQAENLRQHWTAIADKHMKMDGQFDWFGSAPPAGLRIARMRVQLDTGDVPQWFQRSRDADRLTNISAQELARENEAVRSHNRKVNRDIKEGRPSAPKQSQIRPVRIPQGLFPSPYFDQDRTCLSLTEKPNAARGPVVVSAYHDPHAQATVPIAKEIQLAVLQKDDNVEKFATLVHCLREVFGTPLELPYPLHWVKTETERFIKAAAGYKPS